MSLLHFQTRAQRMRFELTAAANSAVDARQRKRKLWNELGIMHDSLVILLEAGVAKDAIAEFLAPLIDAISNADHACNLDIDEAGQTFDEIDLSEARALLAKVRA